MRTLVKLRARWRIPNRKVKLPVATGKLGCRNTNRHSKLLQKYFTWWRNMDTLTLHDRTYTYTRAFDFYIAVYITHRYHQHIDRYVQPPSLKKWIRQSYSCKHRGRICLASGYTCMHAAETKIGVAGRIASYRSVPTGEARTTTDINCHHHVRHPEEEHAQGRHFGRLWRW